MNEESIFDDIDDPEDLKRRKLFQSQLLIIEDKYIDWFKSRPAFFRDREHDEINMHVTIGVSYCCC
jgi:hypothetical protein